MATLKEKTINHIIAVEGGYVDNPLDSGGPTKYGITRQTAREYGYNEDMHNLPRTVAFQIYEIEFWDKLSGDQLVGLSENIAKEVVDTAVNTGKTRAVKFLQESLNVLNRRGTLYDDIDEDGLIGPATLKALRAYLKQREEIALLHALNCLQGTFYIELAQRREKDEAFIYGWLLNRVMIH